MKNGRYDLIIIGGGAAAFSAAIKANRHGVKTAMIERAMLGGTCVNVGCVPSKNLLGAGEILHSAKHPSYPSVFSCDSDFDFAKTIESKDALVRGLRKQKYYDVLQSLEHVELVQADASFVSPKKVKIVDDDGRLFEADKFIIATGSSPSVPRFKGIENMQYLTNNGALALKEKPSSMIVIGGRALGLEFAQMYARFGAKVTLLQRSDRIIPDHEPEISQGLHQHLTEEEGIEIITDVNVREVWQKNGSKFVRASVKNKEERVFEAEQLLMATGRRPNTADLHLENAGVKLRDDGAIIVNSEMRTSASHIWAGGDVVGEPMLETLAAKAGATAAENALTGGHKKIDLLSVPSAVFTSPQVASVGMTEEQMMQKYGYCSCRTLLMKDVPKALTVNDTRGLIKMAVDPKKNNRIVGVHILASIAADMIHEAVVAVKYRLTIDDIIDTVHVFPTMSEAIKLVATAFKQDVSKLSCCAE
ncbi:mercury(II) reductase [Nitrososphaera viennensis]|nr:mercury(II) reductase [Nitrososphaera viennensis]UVS70392.1 mercury(II) reductase [Nitrososphaera viennensis]